MDAFERWIKHRFPGHESPTLPLRGRVIQVRNLDFSSVERLS